MPDPVLMSFEEARLFLGRMSKTVFYECLAKQAFRARKCGRRTLIETASLREFADALPVMQPRTTKAA